MRGRSLKPTIWRRPSESKRKRPKVVSLESRVAFTYLGIRDYLTEFKNEMVSEAEHQFHSPSEYRSEVVRC
ncbi:hypothetical protein ETAA8_08810 [Anatilimnocola aggregata]|uniref:Uncharacterized protein n=1 Tax=Anatilimnocola aggregata TaxID=2528021 RepID=A0A517Y6E7_9BACT|nr:hypothetical protein ETAA8_08810 [Anatilimnocola aggregata]